MIWGDTFDIGEKLKNKFSESTNEISKIYDTSTEIDDFLICIFQCDQIKTFKHDYLIKLMHSFRRNYLISGFLILTKQTSSGFLITRSLIESGEILISYLIDHKSVIEIINSDINKNSGVKVRSIAHKYIKISKNEQITNLSTSIKKYKDVINDHIAHSNPGLSLTKFHGIDEKDSLADIFDSNNSINMKMNYLNLMNIYNSIIELIYTIGCTSDFNYLITRKGEYPDFKLYNF